MKYTDNRPGSFTTYNYLRFFDLPFQLDEWVWTNKACTCQLTIPSFATSSPAINPKGGESITLTAAIAEKSGKTIHWTLELGDTTYRGDDKNISVSWDGKDSQGRLLDDGVYIATLTTKTTDGDCGETATLVIQVENYSSCQLEVQFGSMANLANGNLSQQLKLFAPSGTSLGPTVTLHYNSLDRHNGPLGLGWSHSYELALFRQGDGSLLLRQGNGMNVLYRYAEGGYRPPPGEYSTLVPESEGYTLTTKEGVRIVFDPQGTLTSIMDRNDNAMLFSSAGALTRITDSVGRIASFHYDDQGKLREIVNPAGKVYSFTVAGDTLTQIVLPDHSTYHYTYDPDGFMNSHTDRGGFTTVYRHDNRHRVLSTTDPEGKSRSISYALPSEALQTTELTEKDGSIWQYHFIAKKGELQAKTDPNGNTTSYLHDDLHNLLRQTETDGGVNTYRHDKKGNTIWSSDALGQETSFSYNDFGQPTSLTNAAGTTTVAYDERGNLATVTDPSGNQTRYDFDPRGRLRAVVNPAGQNTSYRHNELGQLVAVTDSSGATLTMTHDADGRVTSHTTPNGQTTFYAYDQIGNLVKTTDPLGKETVFEYDGKGNRNSRTDANGNTTRWDYNYQGQVIRMQDANGNPTTLAYGGNAGCASCPGGADKLTVLTDANGNGIWFTYDSLGRLTRETDQLANTTSQDYDAKGNLVRRTDPNGDTIIYDYDLLGRLLRKRYPDGTSTIFSYDHQGRLATAANQHLTYTLSYDPLGRLLTISDDHNHAISSQYDILGNRTRLSLPDGQTLTYTHDQANRLNAITSPLGNFTFTHDPMGRRATLRYPNRVTIAYEYDQAERLEAITTDLDRHQPLANFVYTHDLIGNRLSRDSLHRHDTYDYDPTSQLTMGTSQPQDRNRQRTQFRTEQFGYDGVGNRESYPAPRTPTVYNRLNQLLADQHFTYQYDANGNLRAKTHLHPGATAEADEELAPIAYRPDPDPDESPTPATDTQFLYDWDYENQLRKVVRTTRNHTIITSFKYDPFGRRIEKRVETRKHGNDKAKTTIHTYLHDQEDLVQETISKPNNKHDAGETTTFLHGPGIDEPLALSGPRGQFFYHADGLGSIVALTNRHGEIVQRHDYSAFGLSKKHGGEPNQPYSFTGREWDNETGLYYYRARYYDPLSGRFISKDPMGLAGGDVNLYRYVENNPVNWIDPWGLCPNGTHEATPNEVAKIIGAGEDISNNGLSHEEMRCNQFVAASIRKYFPNALTREFKTDDIRRGQGPFQLSSVPETGNIALFNSPSHVMFITGMRSQNISQFLGSQTSTGPAYVNLPDYYWQAKLNSKGNVTYYSICLPNK